MRGLGVLIIEAHLFSFLGQNILYISCMHVSKNIYCKKYSPHCVKYIYCIPKLVFFCQLYPIFTPFIVDSSTQRKTFQQTLTRIKREKKSFLDSIKRQTGYKTSHQDSFSANYSISLFLDKTTEKVYFYLNLYYTVILIYDYIEVNIPIKIH